MLQSVSADVAKRRLGTFNPDDLHGHEHVQHHAGRPQLPDRRRRASARAGRRHAHPLHGVAAARRSARRSLAASPSSVGMMLGE